MVLGQRLHAWMEDVKEEERTAQVALKVRSETESQFPSIGFDVKARVGIR